MEEHARKGKLPRWMPLFEYSQVYQELGREEEARANMAEALKTNTVSFDEKIDKIQHYHPKGLYNLS